MTRDELTKMRDNYEANCLALTICAVHHQHLISLLTGCIENPSKDNLAILKEAEFGWSEFLQRVRH